MTTTPTVKPCPVRGCGATIRAGSPFCSPCWQRLPEYVRQGISGQFDYRGADAYREALDFLNQRGPLPPHWRESA